MKHFLRGLSAMTLVNVINGLLGVIIVPVAVARLGIEGYGLYSIFPVLAGYLLLVELGLGKNLVRVLGGAPSEAASRDLLRLALGLYLAIAALLVLLAPVIVLAVGGILFRVPETHAATVTWIAVIAVLDYLLGIPVSLRLNYTLSRERMDAYARFQLVSHASRYTLMLAGVLLTQRAEVAVAFLLGRRLVDLAAAPLLLPALPTGSWRPRVAAGESRALLGQSSLMALTQLLLLSTIAAGSVLVNAFFGLAALGVYRSTFDIVSKVWFLSSTAGIVIFPRLVKLLRQPESRARVGRILPGVQSASWMAYSAVAIIGALAAPVIVRLMRLGETPPLLFGLLLTGVLWNAHAVVSIEVLQAEGRFRAVVETTAISFGLMTAVFLALAGREPTLAIGWAWLVSQLVASTWVDVYAVRPFRGREAAGVIGLARVPGALLVLSTLAWLGGLWWPPVLAASVIALALSARELPGIRSAILDLSGRA